MYELIQDGNIWKLYYNKQYIKDVSSVEEGAIEIEKMKKGIEE